MKCKEHHVDNQGLCHTCGALMDRDKFTAYWGEKCPDFDPECAVCQAWHAVELRRQVSASGYCYVEREDSTHG